jgi:hypothetical protein
MRKHLTLKPALIGLFMLIAMLALPTAPAAAVGCWH